MKAAQQGTQLPRKDGPSAFKNHQLQSQNGYSSSPKPLAGPAGYTLPGVISYLTSEFTNLERFKIVNNIEKSELKFKIQLLVSEVNSLKFINNKQSLRIKELEAQLQSSTSKNSGTSARPNDSLAVNDGKESLKLANENNNIHDNNNSSTTSASELEKIPPVDLQVLRDARLRLNAHIREALEFLKPPTANDLMDEYDMNATSEFKKLLDDSESTQFYEPAESRGQKESLFSLYTLNSAELLARRSAAQFNDSGKSLPSPSVDIVSDLQLPPDLDVVGIPTGEISETETVIVDEPDVARLLLSEDEKIENEIFKDDKNLPPLDEPIKPTLS